MDLPRENNVRVSHDTRYRMKWEAGVVSDQRNDCCD
jgi:hypothetical protein